MEREQELKKLINVLHRTARTAMRVQWMQAGENEARFAVGQYNRILARLGELDPNTQTIFPPLPEDSSLTTVAMACRQVVSYYEDEVRVEEERDARGFGFKFGAFSPECGAKDFTLEDVGNWIRDRLQEIGQHERERRAEKKPGG